MNTRIWTGEKGRGGETVKMPLGCAGGALRARGSPVEEGERDRSVGWDLWANQRGSSFSGEERQQRRVDLVRPLSLEKMPRSGDPLGSVGRVVPPLCALGALHTD